MLACLLQAIVLQQVFAISEHVLTLWRIREPNAWDAITTEAQLHAYMQQEFVSPVLSGGLGNCMYQMAASHVLARRLRVPCIVAWWDQRESTSDLFRRFQDRGDPYPGITLGAIFPNLIYVDFDPEFHNVQHGNQTLSDFSQFYTAISDDFVASGKRYLAGFYFAAQHWHHERQFLLQHVFVFHHVLIRYVEKKYWNLVFGPLESVSVHMRLGVENEPMRDTFQLRGPPSFVWYKNVMLRQFLPAKSVFLIFTDSPKHVRALMEVLVEEHQDVRYLLVDEDVATSLALMSMCQHHVVAISTFSFWGAYLDKRQPHGGKTVIHARYDHPHGPDSIPFREWIRIGDDYNKEE